MIKLFKPLLLVSTLFCLLSLSVFADGVFVASSPEPSFPEISAQSYVICDAKTGEVLFAQNENNRMPIASTTKVLTCLVALENAGLDEMVTVTADSCGIEGSSIYLYEGEKLTVRDLLYGLMLESANDAATCIAIHVAGDVASFSDMMNKKAAELQLANSHFNNPHGLEDPEHYSSALDMSRIWCEAMKNSNFREIVSSKTYRIDLDNDEGYRFLSNHNKLLKTYDSSIGGKTGYTKNAGRCLVSGAEYNGVELVMVTLNDPNDWADHENMLDYAFSLYTTVDVAEEGSISHTLPVVGAKKKQIELKNTDRLVLTLRDVSRLQTKLVAPRFVYAPVLNTELPLAKVVYLVDGKEIASLPLYPTEKLVKQEKESIFKRLINIFR